MQTNVRRAGVDDVDAPLDDAEQQFLSMIADQAFPCVGAKSAAARGSLQVLRARDITSAWNDLQITHDLLEWSWRYKDEREGLRSLPPLLKGYVRAGCRIGDGAVIDRQFGTTDVFIYFPLSGIDARYKSRFGLVK